MAQRPQIGQLLLGWRLCRHPALNTPLAGNLALYWRLCWYKLNPSAASCALGTHRVFVMGSDGQCDLANDAALSAGEISRLLAGVGRNDFRGCTGEQRLCYYFQCNNPFAKTARVLIKFRAVFRWIGL